jgi:hypothetical protein
MRDIVTASAVGIHSHTIGSNYPVISWHQESSLNFREVQIWAWFIKNWSVVDVLEWSFNSEHVHWLARFLAVKHELAIRILYTVLVSLCMFGSGPLAKAFSWWVPWAVWFTGCLHSRDCCICVMSYSIVPPSKHSVGLICTKFLYLTWG